MMTNRLVTLCVQILVLSPGLLVKESWAVLLTSIIGMHKTVKTDFLVDLTHPFGVSLGHADRSKEQIHLFERQRLGLWEEEVDESGASKGPGSDVSNELLHFMTSVQLLVSTYSAPKKIYVPKPIVSSISGVT